jgi:L-lactate dehydrogenase (cytochrome)
LNLYDFEHAAQRILSKKSWAFQSAAANDSLTHAANSSFYRRIYFRPRVMVGVKNVSTRTKIMGYDFEMPIFFAPAALAKLSHPEGELAIARETARQGSAIVACNNASFSYPEIVSALPDNYPSFYQLYINKDRAVTEKIIREVSSLNPLAIIITADLPVVGKREADERVRIDDSYSATQNMQTRNVNSSTRDKKGAGLARATGSFIDPDFQWSDLPHIRSLTSIPIFIKGIQSAADAKRAFEAGCAGIYISNHGGRAVDTAQPAILVLMEINAVYPEVLAGMEVFIDGGIRRGTDVLKAVCLGATAVCLGRGVLWGLCYGEEGVGRVLESKVFPFLFFSFLPPCFFRS